MDTPQQHQNIISLCTGIRGIERGIERAGTSIRAVCHVEIEAIAIYNLVAQMENGVLDEAPIWTNLKTFDGRLFRGKVHGITGGYPCQPFSTAGRRNGKDDPRHLYPHISRIIDTVRPFWCFFENVRGHLSLGYREVREDLERLGYTVEEGIFSAEEVGASHRRERLFILAVDNSSIERLKQVHKISAGRHSSEYASKLGDSKSSKCQLSWDSRSGWNGSSNASPELANSDSFNGEGIKSKFIDKKKRSLKIKRPFGLQDRIVARPGEPQHEWESPRSVITNQAARLLGGYNKKHPESFLQWQIDQVAFDEFTGSVKPSLGMSIDGYDFREDALRLLGNSVYEQTASKAWITLWSKIYKSTK